MKQQKLNIEYERVGNHVKVLIKGQQDDVHAALARLLDDHKDNTPEKPERKALGFYIADKFHQLSGPYEHVYDREATKRILDGDFPDNAPHRALEIWNDGKIEPARTRTAPNATPDDKKSTSDDKISRDHSGDRKTPNKTPTADNPDYPFSKGGTLTSFPKIELATPQSIRNSMAQYGVKPFPELDPDHIGAVDSIIRELARLQQQLETPETEPQDRQPSTENRS